MTFSEFFEDYSREKRGGNDVVLFQPTKRKLVELNKHTTLNRPSYYYMVDVPEPNSFKEMSAKDYIAPTIK